jgi:thioesterase domain-containing protein
MPWRQDATQAHSTAYRLERLAAAHDQAWAAYEPSPYGGRVLLLAARRQPLGILPDPLLGWGGLLTGDLRVREIPGFRQTLLDEPDVALLASEVAEGLGACATP